MEPEHESHGNVRRRRKVVAPLRLQDHDEAAAHAEAIEPETLFLDRDVDYVAAFKALGRIEHQIQDGNITAALLVERSVTTHALGDYRTSAEDAVLAAYTDPQNAQAHFRAGVAFLALAAVRMEIIPCGPGAGDRAVEETPREVIDTALRAFRIARRLGHERAAEGIRAAQRLAEILTRRRAPP